MGKLQARIMGWVYSEDGASIIEYALLASLIAVVALIAVIFLGDEVSETYSVIADSVVDAGSN